MYTDSKEQARPVATRVIGAAFIVCGACHGDRTPSAQPPAATASEPASADAEADWTAGAVFYGVFPPLFGDRPLVAVTEQIDELAELGVDALWISPVMVTTDPNDFGYAVVDYFHVREDYGTEQDFQALVKRAHEFDMRVVIDFVPNHTSIEHPWVKDPEFHDFYERTEDGELTHYFDWEHLPNLDFDNPEVVKTMTAAMRHWVETYDIDGFRMDAAWGIAERNPEVWPTFVASLRELDPSLYLLAEASAHDRYWIDNGFDAAYDWTDQLGHWAWNGLFDDVSNIGPRLHAAIASGKTPVHQVARFLNNNDTGKRFITRHGPELSRVAATMLLTLPGDAIVYSGDEVGAEYEPYEVAQPLAWNDPHELRPHYKKLAELRESLPGLASNGFTPIATQPTSAYAYLRYATGGRDPVLVVLNFGAATKVTLTFDQTVPPPTLIDRLDGTRVEADISAQTWSLEMPATRGRILLPEGDAKSTGESGADQR